MQVLRNYIRTQFADECGEKNAKSYEKLLYTMCKKISHDTNVPLLDVYKRESYEKYSQVKTNKKLLSNVVKDSGDLVTGYDSCIFDPLKKKNENKIYNTINQSLYQLEKSNIRCEKCKVTGDVVFYTQQTRRADEAETIYFTCLNCGKRWKR